MSPNTERTSQDLNATYAQNSGILTFNSGHRTVQILLQKLKIKVL